MEPVAPRRHYTRYLEQGFPVSPTRPLSVPVVLYAGRQGEPSLQAARFVSQELRQHLGVRTGLIDIGDPRAISMMAGADAIVIVTPEHDRTMPKLEKPTGIVAVSAGAGGGGNGAITTSLAILRPLGLVTLFWDVDPGSVGNVFERDASLRDEAVVRGTHKFLGELIRMAKAFRPACERAERLAGTA